MVNTPPQNLFSNFSLRDFIISMVLNIIVPYLLYTLSKKYLTHSEFIALCIAAFYPILDNLVSIIRRRTLDIIAVITLLGIAVSIIAILFGGNPKILLIRESFFTGALGVVCFISLLLPRPLMFYFGRQMMAGTDKKMFAEYNTRWQNPRVRFTTRLITVVWGIAYVGEFVVRVLLVLFFSTTVVLLVSPILLNGVTIATILWTLGYIRHVRDRKQETTKKRMHISS